MNLFWSLLSGRDDFRPKSRLSRDRYTDRNTMRYHKHDVRGFWVFCGCMGGIRGVHGFSKLGPKRRRDWRWADKYRCYGRRPDREDSW